MLLAQLLEPLAHAGSAPFGAGLGENALGAGLACCQRMLEGLMRWLGDLVHLTLGRRLRLGFRLGLGLSASSLELVDEVVGSVTEELDRLGRLPPLATMLAERSLDRPRLRPLAGPRPTWRPSAGA